MLNFPRWKVWGISLICVLGVLLAVPSFLPATVSAYLPRFVQAVHDQSRPRSRRRQPAAARGADRDVARQRVEAMEEPCCAASCSRDSIADQPSLDGEQRRGQLPRPQTPPRSPPRASAPTPRLSQVGFGGSATGRSRRRRQPHHDAPDPGRHRRGDQSGDGGGARRHRPPHQRARHARADDHPPGRQPHPGPGARPAGSRGAEAADRPHRPARVQAGRRTVTQRAAARSGRAARQPDPAAMPKAARMPHRRPAPRDHHRRADRQRASRISTSRTLPAVRLSFDTAGSHALRPGDPGECRQAVRDHPRQCRHLRAQHPRADPGRHRPISGSFTVETANQLAISLRSGRLPVELQRRRGAHRRPRPRRAIRSAAASSPAIAATLVVILFMLITYGRFGVYTTIGLILNAPDDPRHHGPVQRDPDPARHRRLRAHHRRRGRRQRADQRAHPRGAATRATGCTTRSNRAIARPRPRSSTPTSPT